MTPCEWCPFSGCACPWQGGVNPAAAEADTRAKESDTSALTWENDRSETAPAGASTPVAPGPDHYVTPAVDRRNRG